jgi:hypothetical protein
MPKNHAPVEINMTIGIDATKRTVEPVAEENSAGVLVRGEDFTAFLPRQPSIWHD